MWHFAPIPLGEPERDPREAEFFNTGDLDAATALVRESIQNSLDARLHGDKPIKVRFSFKQVQNPDDLFFNELTDHLNSAGLLPRAYDQGDLLVLTIEDFGTKGLDGPTSFNQVDREGNYFNFWWREGKSQKSGQSAGRWGLGKIVFPVSSQLRAYWGLTTRYDDGRTLLLGKAVLKAHIHEDVRYKYYGYFRNEGDAPIDDPNILSKFTYSFGVTRDHQTGLSIVIPMPLDEISGDSLLRAVITQYFYPIMRQKLIVEVQPCGEQSHILDMNTLVDTALGLDWSDTELSGQRIGALMEFVSDIGTMPEGERFQLLPPQGTQQKISEQQFEPAELQQAKADFNSGKLLGLRVPMTIQPVGKEAEESSFEVYLQKDTNLDSADEYYVRSGITISEIQMLRSRSVRALLYVDDPPVSEFLGDAESPAHTEWKERTEGFRDKYHTAVWTLRYIRSALRALVNILDEPPKELDRNLLKDIFFVQEGVDQVAKPTVSPEPDIPVKPTPSPFHISAVAGGFTARSTEALGEDESIEIRVAYDVRQGDAFSKYTPWDFDLAEMAQDGCLEVDGAEVTSIGLNRIVLEGTGERFRCHVKCFDVRRDVIAALRRMD